MDKTVILTNRGVHPKFYIYNATPERVEAEKVVLAHRAEQLNGQPVAKWKRRPTFMDEDYVY